VILKTSNSVTLTARICFFLVFSLFLTEQISSYHFPLGEKIEMTDSEEGESEKDLDEKEKKEFIQDAFKLHTSILNEHLKCRDNSFSKLLVAHDEVFTPPPKG